MKIRLIILVVLSSFLKSTFGQRIEIGEKIPHTVLRELYNSEQDSIDLKTLNGKFIVFDFWNTRCASCIKGLNAWDSLQRQFADDLVVVAVTHENRDHVQHFWGKNKFLNEIALPTVVSDTVLHNHFPHNGVPHLAWIGRDGRLLHTTNGAYARVEDIRALINGATEHWINKDSLHRPEYSKPLFEWRGDQRPEYGYYSLFTDFIPNLRGDFHIEKNHKNRYLKITYINNAVLGLYYATLQYHPEMQNNKRRLVRVVDSAALWPELSSTNRNEWNKKHRYCYELNFPVKNHEDSAQAFEKMRADLNEFLPYTGKFTLIDTVYYEIVPQKAAWVTGNGKKQNTLFLSEWLDRNDRNAALPILVVNEEVPVTAQIRLDSLKKPTLEQMRQILTDNGYLIIKRKGPLKFFELIETP